MWARSNDPMNSWTERRIAQFVEDWNSGLDAWAMREKYGVRNPGSTAKVLRDRGLPLLKRSNRLRACAMGLPR